MYINLPGTSALEYAHSSYNLQLSTGLDAIIL